METSWFRTPIRGLHSLDAAFLVRVRRWEAAWLTRLMKSLTQLGDPCHWIALAALLMATGGEGSRYALRLAAAASLAVIASQILKRLCRRPRPGASIAGFEPLAQDPDAFSFPSGHSCAAFAVAVVLMGEGLALGPATPGDPLTACGLRRTLQKHIERSVFERRSACGQVWTGEWSWSPGPRRGSARRRWRRSGRRELPWWAGT